MPLPACGVMTSERFYWQSIAKQSLEGVDVALAETREFLNLHHHSVKSHTRAELAESRFSTITILHRGTRAVKMMKLGRHDQAWHWEITLHSPTVVAP